MYIFLSGALVRAFFVCCLIRGLVYLFFGKFAQSKAFAADILLPPLADF